MIEILSAASLVYALNAVWHGLAAVFFGLRPEWTLKRYLTKPEANPVAAHLLRFLGGLNLALVVLALGAIVRPSGARVLVAAALFVANFTQFVVDLRVKREGFTNRHFDATILFGDGAMAAINLLLTVYLSLR